MQTKLYLDFVTTIQNNMAITWEMCSHFSVQPLPLLCNQFRILLNAWTDTNRYCYFIARYFILCISGLPTDNLNHFNLGFENGWIAAALYFCIQNLLGMAVRGHKSDRSFNNQRQRFQERLKHLSIHVYCDQIKWNKCFVTHGKESTFQMYEMLCAGGIDWKLAVMNYRWFAKFK